MVNYSRTRGLFPRYKLCAIALTLACSATLALAQVTPLPDWQRVRSDDPPFSLEIPPGWSFQPVEGRGARIVPPDGGPVVEVVAWTALRPPATPDTAAVEHEGVLSRVVDYRRDGMEEITTDDGAPALVVTGRVRWRGTTEDSIFCAYSAGATHYVLGTFASKDALPGLRTDALDRMMRSFSAAAGASPGTTPPQPLPEPEADFEPEHAPAPVPETDTEPNPRDEVDAGDGIGEAQPGDAPATLRVGGQLEPVGPEVREPQAPWVEHLNPSGFSVSIPMDWEVEVVEGLIRLSPALDGEGGSAVLIWPVTGPSPGAEAALRMALTRVPYLAIARVTSVDETDGATIIDAQVIGGRRLVAAWSYDGTFGLLQAVIARTEDWQSEQPRLARMAASFRPGEWAVPYRSESEVSGEADLLRFELPVGWEAHGGVVEDGGDLSIDIEAAGPSEDAPIVRWQQPMHPRFRALTPLLESLGWRESERYSAPDGGEGLTIYRRREPEQLVRDMLLPRQTPQLRLTAIDARPAESAVAGLLPQSEAVGQAVIVKGGSEVGPREGLYLAASAAAQPPLSTTCWDAAFLQAGAPEGQLADAVEVLATMVRTARVTDATASRRTGRLQQMVERAQRALASIPAELRPQAATGLASVIGGGTPGGHAATWRVPGSAREYWSEQAGDEGAVNILGAPVGTRPGE